MEKIQHFNPFDQLEIPDGNPYQRLITAIFVRALADFHHGNESLRINAQHFFYSDDFSYYCSLLYGTECESEVDQIRKKMIGEGPKKMGRYGRTGLGSWEARKKKQAKSLILGIFLFLGIGVASATPSHQHQRCNNIVKAFTQNDCSMARLNTFDRPQRQAFRPKDETGKIITNFLQKEMIRFDQTKPRSNWSGLTSIQKGILFAKIQTHLGTISEISAIEPNASYSLLSVTYPGLGIQAQITPSQFFTTGKYLSQICRSVYRDKAGVTNGVLNTPATFDGIDFATPSDLFWYVANRILLMEPEARYYEILQILGITPTLP